MDKISIRIRRFNWLIKNVFKPKYIKIYFFLSLVINLALLFISIWIFKNIDNNIMVLHYNIDFGIDLVGDPVRIFIFPVLAFLIFITNYVLVLVFNKKKYFKYITYLLPIISFISNTFLLAAISIIYLLNFR
ncbi:hypothetical protein EOL94_02345 [bacterium]|nr:hypothetical protein [bacterium]